jgi:hypothetical protein
VEAYETAIYGDTLRPILNAAAIILAATRGNVEESRRRYELLKPYCGTMMYSVFADRILGLSAWTAGDTAAADGHFRDALVFGRENGCLKDLAWTCSDYAEMLLERAEGASSASGIGDREKAIELQNEALAITQELGMRPLTERILTRREILKA